MKEHSISTESPTIVNQCHLQIEHVKYSIYDILEVTKSFMIQQ